ncbi:DMT family transporter [Silvibacterium dinghuense]|uniref:DMT family transporter n=1 Tax=Silvibacterium dinghuense TaxID=1560006 RepID=A0A4Q1SBM5_9BACT|nr:DMT family transporter [Silvibacterium dinghuense]RXS94538.1 DMT family transporter [Silvibacterium dinghuense]GGH15488.1 hypothetical protein GCM10011586_36600 [Silvibacterium dinghuense]
MRPLGDSSTLSSAQAQARTRISSAVLLVAASLLWSGQGVAVKLLTGHLQPLAIALLPFYAVTTAGLLLLSFRKSDENRWTRAWQHRHELLFVGIGGQLLAQVGMTLGVSESLASDGAILSMLIPILSTALATWLLREQLTRLRVISLLMGFAGVLLLSGNLPAHAVAGLDRSHALPLEGNLMIAAGCIGSAFYNVYSKRLLAQFSELEILFFSYLATALCGLPLLILFAPHCLSDLSRLRLPSWLALSYLAFGLYGLSMVLFLRALRWVDAILASASLYLVPLFGVALGISVLHESLSLQTMAGSAVILLSALLLFRYDGTLAPCPSGK